MFIERPYLTIKKIKNLVKNEQIVKEYLIRDGIYHLELKDLTPEQIESIRSIDKSIMASILKEDFEVNLYNNQSEQINKDKEESEINSR